MKLKPRNVFFLALAAFTLAALALVPLHATFAAPATRHPVVSLTGPHYQKLDPNTNLTLFPQPPLLYNGGPVMANTAHVYTIFWEPSGFFVQSGYNALFNRFFTDVGNSGLYNNDSQYSQGNGAAPVNEVLQASIVDTNPFPTHAGAPNTLVDADLQNEIHADQVANGWTPNIDNLFFIFLPRGEDLCFDTTFSVCFATIFCGYHNLSSVDNTTIYAAIPYVKAAAGCDDRISPNHNDADAAINTSSHELNESVTDPHLDAWFDVNGNEIGDKCNFNFGPAIVDGGDVLLNGDPYFVQKEWDNAQQRCVLSGP